MGPVKPKAELKLELIALTTGAKTILVGSRVLTAVAYRPTVGIEDTIELAIFALVKAVVLKMSLALTVYERVTKAPLPALAVT